MTSPEKTNSRGGYPMSNSTHLDEIRRRALELADNSERRWKRAIVIFAAVEATGWISFILLAWLGSSVAVLLGVAVLILYTMIVTWTFALKEHIDNCTQRILKAMDSTPNPAADKPA
jgi:hypothetical protein